MIEILGDVLVRGEATGQVLASDEPLSLWGGLDPATGEIIDRRHPLSGRILKGRVLVIPFGRGSCSASGVLLEAVALGHGPAGIIVSRADPILGLGAVLVDEVLKKSLPMIQISDVERHLLQADWHATIEACGRITVRPPHDR